MENVHDTRIVIKRRSEPEFPIHFRTANDFENLLQHFKSQQPTLNRDIWCERAPTDVKSIVWEYWRAGYERSYHGEPAIIDLGEIG
jgi:hypothetical protein